MTSGKHRGNEFPGEVLWLCLGTETNTKDPLICRSFVLVEVTRLELATSRSLTVRATGLRYTSFYLSYLTK